MSCGGEILATFVYNRKCLAKNLSKILYMILQVALYNCKMFIIELTKWHSIICLPCCSKGSCAYVAKPEPTQEFQISVIDNPYNVYYALALHIYDQCIYIK